MFANKNTNAEEKINQIAVYWGTFDPVTQAHFEIIKQVLKLDFKKVIVAVNDNQSTGKTYKSPGLSRMKMLALMRKDLSPVEQSRLFILRQRNKELEYQNIKKLFPNEIVTAIVGQDSFEKFGAGCKWCDKVLVVPRGNMNSELELKGQIEKLGLSANTHILAIKKQFIATSSTEVRAAINIQRQDILQASMHPDVISYINYHGFFRGDLTATEHDDLKIFKRWLEKRKLLKSKSKSTLHSLERKL